ncbi:DegV family protein [Thermoproteota archaeon]
MSKKRKLYKIGYITKLLDITPRTIRYYDQYGLLPHVKRSSGNVRLFDDEDIEILKKVRRMQKEEYLPLDVIKERLFTKEKKAGKSSSVVVTDSTAALPKEVIKQLNIHVLPQRVVVSNKAFLDGQTITARQYAEKCKGVVFRPKIEAPRVADYVKLFKDINNKGIKKIYCAAPASSLSEAYLNAVEASYKVSNTIDVEVIDSKSTAGGLGLFVQTLAAAVKNLESEEEINILISKGIPLGFNLIAVNSLRYLVTGGVINESNKAQIELLCKVFDYKPVIGLNGENGEIEILGFYQTKEEILQNLVERVSVEIANRGKYAEQIRITYSFLYADAVELVNRLKSLYPQTVMTIVESSAVMSVYLGTEYLGISVL